MTDTLYGTIDGYNHEGMGILRLYQQVVFIPGALDGEEVKVRLPKGKTSNVVWAELTDILKPSPHRKVPSCSNSSRCGACQLQHVSYTHQLEIKQAILQRAMLPLRKDDLTVLSKIKQIIPALEPSHYRNKGIFAVGQIKENQNGDPIADIGFYARHSRDVAGHGCPVLFSDKVNALLDDLSHWLGKETILLANPELAATYMPHHFLIRESKSTGNIVLIALCEKEPQWIPSFLSAFKPVDSDRPYTLSGIGWFPATKNNPIPRGKPKILWRPLYIQEDLYIKPLSSGQTTTNEISLRFRISPEAFFQVNTRQANILYSEALKACNLSGNEVLWDLYCGSGTISLFLACQAKAVLGIDIVEASIRDAWLNTWINTDVLTKTNKPTQSSELYPGDWHTARLHRRLCFLAGSADDIIPYILQHTDFLSATLQKQVKLYTDRNGTVRSPSKELVSLLSSKSPDIIVLDPPARGVDRAVLKAVIALKPSKILYVSCNPATLARDLQILLPPGIYRIDSIQPLDMFPQTAHIETLVLLTAQDAIH